jgi:hypothetical protein
MLDCLTSMLISFYPLSELVDDGSGPGVFPYLLLFIAALLMTLVGVLMTFAPRLLLRFGRWQRQKMGGPLGALENISEIEKQPSWRRRQLVPGLFALGFGLFLLRVLLRSLFH